MRDDFSVPSVFPYEENCQEGGREKGKLNPIPLSNPFENHGLNLVLT